MIEQLKSAVEQLHTAWDTYSSAYSTLQTYTIEKAGSHMYGFPPEILPLLDAELDFLSSLPSKIKQTETAIRRARNYSSGVAPINALPSEILTRIFFLVPDQPCQFYKTNHTNGTGGWIGFPRYPDYLTHVCSHWRQTAILCPFLWHHIDLTLSEQWYPGLYDRADVYNDRARGIPIELHVTEGYDGVSYREEDLRDSENLFDLVRWTAHHVGTLELVVTGRFGPYHHAVFDGLFFTQESNLTKLVLCSRSYHQDTFIFPTSLNRHELYDKLDHFGLDIPESKFARGFSTITILHARGIFPFWSSTAYHGLVDLRLLSTYEPSHIDEVQIRTILESSPALRILHFGLKIENTTPEAENVRPVALHDLEVVRVFSAGKAADSLCSSVILRLLAPGEKPLRLSLDSHYAYVLQETLPSDLDRFLSRAKVVQVYIWGVIIPLSIVLRHSAHLENIVLTYFDAQSQHQIRASLAHTNPSDSLRYFNSLHLRNSRLSQGDLRVLLSHCPSGIVLDRCNIYHDESEGLQGTKLSGEELSTAFPEVKIAAASAKDPTADWDILN